MLRHPERLFRFPNGSRRLILLLAGCCLALLSGVGSLDMAAQQPGPPAPSHQALYLPAISSGGQVGSGPSGRSDSWPAGRFYTVRAGDTLLSVALEMGVDLGDMACLLSPTFTWKQPLVIGDTLRVPEVPFVCHRVLAGETLQEIADRYDVAPAVIREESWNALAVGGAVPGRNLRVPLAASAPALAEPVPVAAAISSLGEYPAPLVLPADWPYGSGRFAWPTYGWLTQGFGIGHQALDIAAPQGTLVTAADRGVVIRAGWSSVGYGKFVVIDHNIDYITLYAHLSEILVSEGDVVAQGQVLGRVGSTGNSSGAHLHFEIRDFGRRVDPLSLLPH